MAEKDQSCSSASSCSRESCEGCPSKSGNSQSFRVDQNAYSNIKHVIGVVSGKGGVGKSLVTASLANALAKTGASVGILDADITGPSIPKMYGLTGPADALDENQILPELTANGIKVMSLNLIMPDPEQAVVWRGPIIAGVVKQFWTDVVWGELDYLLVDMPPGTGDVPLTVFQSLPVDGIFIVTSPQDLVRMIVAKAVNMAKLMNVPVLGVIENYSYLKCPDCGRKIDVFGKSRVEEVAKETGIPLAGQIPIDPEYAQMSDEGRFADVDNTYIAQTLELLRNV
ncbi:MAG: Mrp/NBP35 family ATP-binding protein [Lachnospiraceae bacterium]|nr:Mrp/NBP35 family ATP-binding protein [Lachnospiraceae bacterium]